ncbi:TMEM175 family protein [Emticicia fontis]
MKENEKRDFEKYETEKHELPYERVLFFSDAIVAIAITLLALELKIEVPEGEKLQFADLLKPWHKYLGFILSFISISGFWSTHHRLFTHIKRMDERLKWFNTLWLFFIVTLPFSTSVLSDHLNDPAAVFFYALNIFLISMFQNFLWDYASWDKNNFVDDGTINEENKRRFRIMFNLDMLNGLIALIVSFFAPMVAFILLYVKLPVMVFGTIYIASLRRKGLEKQGERRRGRKK